MRGLEARERGESRQLGSTAEAQETGLLWLNKGRALAGHWLLQVIGVCKSVKRCACPEVCSTPRSRKGGRRLGCCALHSALSVQLQAPSRPYNQMPRRTLSKRSACHEAMDLQRRDASGCCTLCSHPLLSRPNCRCTRSKGCDRTSLLPPAAASGLLGTGHTSPSGPCSETPHLPTPDSTSGATGR